MVYIAEEMKDPNAASKGKESLSHSKVFVGVFVPTRTALIPTL